MAKKMTFRSPGIRRSKNEQRGKFVRWMGGQSTLPKKKTKPGVQ